MRVKEASDAVRKAVIYQINLRVFTKEGTIIAAEKFLPDIVATGADIVYLCPFTEADDDTTYEYWSERQRRSGCLNPRNPYRLMDYFKVDPEYGTLDDFKSFVNAAHKLNLKVMMDLVYMHAGPTFGKRFPQFVKHDTDGKPLLNGYHFCTIDFDVLELREYLWKNMLYFVMECGIDAYRCDVGGAIPLDFWVEGVRRIKKLRPDFLMLNEHELKRRPEDQQEAFDINYSQGWIMSALREIFAFGLPTHVLEMVWLDEHAAAENGMSLRCIEHHDTANDMYYNRVEKISSAKCEAALVLCYCVDGVPFLYNGCEYKDTSRHSIFGLKGQFTIERSRDPSERMALLRQLAEIHRGEKAILFGTTRWSAHDRKESVAAIVRSAGSDAVFCAVNLSNEKQVVRCDDFTGFANGKVLLERGFEKKENGFVLDANSFIVIRKENSDFQR
ncbi:MAG: alpha-amylase family glycosyl hydrolase [Lentisphaeria bacterium]